jgi:hypothetical protein
MLSYYCLAFFIVHFTSKPSSRKHILCASINLIQSGSSSPLNTTHSSRAFLVSGQQQQIGFPVLIPNFFFGFSYAKEREREREKKRGRIAFV